MNAKTKITIWLEPDVCSAPQIAWVAQSIVVNVIAVEKIIYLKSTANPAGCIVRKAHILKRGSSVHNVSIFVIPALKMNLVPNAAKDIL
jgi:hypothetical protein